MFPRYDPSAPNCIDCPDHETQVTPDPDDWFCDDDITVSCRAPGGRTIAPGIRPQFEREYCMVPAWCPKRRRAAGGWLKTLFKWMAG